MLTTFRYASNPEKTTLALGVSAHTDHASPPHDRAGSRSASSSLPLR